MGSSGLGLWQVSWNRGLADCQTKEKVAALTGDRRIASDKQQTLNFEDAMIYLLMSDAAWCCKVFSAVQIIFMQMEALKNMLTNL